MSFMKGKEIGGMKMIKKKDFLPSPPSYIKLSRKGNGNDGGGDDDDGSSNEGGTTPKGHVPVMVGEKEGELKRFVVPTRFMKDPPIVALLQLSADEFGYNHDGVLHIHCQPEYFQNILGKLAKLHKHNKIRL